MEASLNALFGNAETTPVMERDSYGLRPPAYRLPEATRIRAVVLQVSDLPKSRSFYEGVLGFRPLTVAPTRVALGAEESDDVLIELVERRSGHPGARKQTLGLYHVAILLPSRGDLGRFVHHLSETGARAGAGDHLVSEAFYLQDPDNLGIEVYADRPRETWKHSDRQLVMATDPVDVRSVVESGGGLPWTGMPAGTTIGHVHLHVGDLAQSSRFYSDALGFDRMVWSYPGALFLAAGGYHHHLGNNTWAGPEAKPAGPDDPQLLEWVLEVPTEADVASAADSLRSHGYEVTPHEHSVTASDPWGTTLRLQHVVEATP